MRQLVLDGPRALRLRDVADLEPAAGQVRVAVHAAGVCGSDVHGYRGVNDRRAPGVVMGHEVSGTIDRAGPGVDAARIGQPVVVNPLLSCGSCAMCSAGRDNLCPDKALVGCVPHLDGGFADQLLVPATSAVPFIGAAPLLWGAFVEPLAVGLHAVDVGDVAGRNVTVIGSGAVGVSAALSARRRGAASVTVVSLDHRRRALIGALGMTAAGLEGDPGAPADIVVDCVASTSSIATALRDTTPAGTVVVVGFGHLHTQVPMTPLVHGERVVRGSAQYPFATFVEAARWLSSGAIELGDALAPPVPLEAGPDLFREAGAQRHGHLRHVLVPRVA